VSEAETGTLSVLLLGESESGSALSEWLRQHARIQQVGGVDDALAALRSSAFDLVVSVPELLLPLREAYVQEQAPAVFDAVNQGVCVVGKSGDLIWANPKMAGFPAEVRQRACQYCRETLHALPQEPHPDSTPARGRRSSFTTTGNEYYEISVTPVSDHHDQITQAVAVVWNTTDLRRLQDKIDAIDRAGRALVSLDAEHLSRLNIQQRLELLERRILESVHDLLNFDNFAIMVLDKRSNKLEMLLSWGMLPEAQQTELFASPEGSGISGYVAARGRSYICPDVTRDPRYLSGIQGARSSLTIPLRLHDEVVAVANFESTRPAAFTEDDRQFAEIFGRYVAIALHILELLISERYTATGQVGSNVMAEITAPLNDILSEVERLTEDYIGHDDLRHRLRVVSENAVKVRDSIKNVITAKSGLVGARQGTPAQADALLSGKHVLVADDEEVIRETIRDVLEGLGCQVVCAAEGAAAVALLGTDTFDLVISDIKMPGRNGYEVFAAAKQANAATPVILMTGFGYDPNHSIVRARREGLAAVLFKPFKVDQLLHEIRTALKAVAT